MTVIRYEDGRVTVHDQPSGIVLSVTSNPKGLRVKAYPYTNGQQIIAQDATRRGPHPVIAFYTVPQS